MMHLTLQMVGACSLIDVIIGLKGRPFSKAWVDIDSKRASESPKVFTLIEMIYNISGDVPLRLVEGLVEKSHEKYCSVSNMITPKVKIEHSCVVYTPE